MHAKYYDIAFNLKVAMFFEHKIRKNFETSNEYASRVAKCKNYSQYLDCNRITKFIYRVQYINDVNT